MQRTWYLIDGPEIVDESDDILDLIEIKEDGQRIATGKK